MARVIAFNTVTGKVLSGRRGYAKWVPNVQLANVYRDVGSARTQAENNVKTAIEATDIVYKPVTLLINAA